MKVLINAFAFSPSRGSEHAVGWNIATELAKLHDVTVIFGDVWGNCKTRVDLEKHTGQVGSVFDIAGLRAVYVCPTKLIALITVLHKIPGCWMLYYWAYRLWQKRAYRVAKELNSEHHFDVVHQLNMIGYREPGYMWKLGIPFVWGPVGGAPNEPLAYLRQFSFVGGGFVLVRYILNEIQKRTCWRARKAAKCAKKIWAVTDADYKMIHDIWGKKCDRMVEAGTDVVITGNVRTWNDNSPLRIAWSGLHIARKSLPILILALEKVRSDIHHLNSSPSIIVDILGEGPETEKWKRLAEKAGVADCLVWHGRLPRSEALGIMQRAHLLACPSVKEASSIVVIEAISMGLPVICHDACGMGIVVTDRCGIKVPLMTPERSVTGFAKAIEDVIRRCVDLSALSRGALQRAKELTWEEKAKVISAAYKEVAK